MSYKALWFDVASYQGSNAYLFNTMASKGGKGVAIKLTEGDESGSNYKNPYAAGQISLTKSNGMKVSAYHFGRYSSDANARQEANFFVKQAKALGLPASTVMICDAEVKTAANYQSATNAFCAQVKALGYPNVVVYTYKSFVQSGYLKEASTPYPIWIANYINSGSLGVNNAVAWQYTDNWNGMGVDASWDFNGMFTKEDSKPAVTPKPAAKPAAKKSTAKISTFTDTLGVVWYKEKGKFTLSQDINLRWGAKTNSSLISTLKKGSYINYDAFCYSGGYVWLRQPRQQGYGYLASGESKGSKRSSYWGKFS